MGSAVAADFVKRTISGGPVEVVVPGVADGVLVEVVYGRATTSRPRSWRGPLRRVVRRRVDIMHKRLERPSHRGLGGVITIPDRSSVLAVDEFGHRPRIWPPIVGPALLCRTGADRFGSASAVANPAGVSGSPVDDPKKNRTGIGSHLARRNRESFEPPRSAMSGGLKLATRVRFQANSRPSMPRTQSKTDISGRWNESGAAQMNPAVQKNHCLPERQANGAHRLPSKGGRRS